MSRLDAHVLILGAGHAGGTAAALLRQYGFEGSITLVGEETIAPYHRPPLSKACLRDGPGAVSLLLKPAEFYAGHGIDFRPGIRAEKLARRAMAVTLSTSEVLTYDCLNINTGARPINLPVAGSDLAGVLELRTVADAERLRAVMRSGQRLAVIGGGYIGLAVARVARPELSAFFLDYHRKRGVSFELGATVSGFEGRD